MMFGNHFDGQLYSSGLVHFSGSYCFLRIYDVIPKYMRKFLLNSVQNLFTFIHTEPL